MATATKEHGRGSITSHLRTLLGRIRSLAADAATWARDDAPLTEAASTPGAVANAAAYAHGQVAARIGSHGLCDRYERHGPHLETTGIVDNGGNVVLHQCPGQYSDCSNCEDQKCMSCVMRDWHERCADDCPDCCGPPDEREEQVAELRSRIAALVNPAGDPNPAWDIAVASIVHEVLAVFPEAVARAWDEGERHESTYLARTGQFCPHGTACNPYRNEREREDDSDD